MLASFVHPNALSVNAINALIKRENWAQDKIAQHAGKTVKINIASFSFWYTLQSNGLLAQADSAILPNVTLSLPQDKLKDLPQYLGKAQSASDIANLLHIEGEASLAQLVSDLALNLRWDLERDLAKVVGDVPAVKVLQLAKQFKTGVETSTQKAAANVAEYLGYESGLLVTKPALMMIQADMHLLNQQLLKLEQRVAKK